VVIDATWRHAKAMHRKFCKTHGSEIPQVQLSPTALSVYARTQSQPDRICTVEAVALLLQHLGEEQTNCDALVDYVKLNNRALKGAVVKREKDLCLYEGPGANPAWYFGRRHK
jgi:DTW domain-containing protein YfiP